MNLEKLRLGYYPENNRKLFSVTSIKEFTLGLSPQLAKWIEKQTMLAMTRKQRELKRNLTQKEILAFGKEAREKILNDARSAGVEVHQAIQNHNSQLPYELHPDHQYLFEAYTNWAKDKTIIPILEEYKVRNFDYGYAGRLDFYGKINGRYCLVDYKSSTIVDWAFGLQLAAYRECLEKEGFQVDDMIILHLKPWIRGGVPTAEAHYFNTPFKGWEALLTLFHTKLATLSPSEIEFYDRTDAGAVQEQIKESLAMEAKLLESQTPDSQGHQQDTQDTEPILDPIDAEFHYDKPLPVYLNQAGTPTAEQLLSVLQPELQTPTTHSSLLPETLDQQTSLHKTEIRPESTPLVSLLEGEIAVFDKPRILRDPSTPPLERHTSVPRPEDSDDELDIRPARRKL